MAESKIQWTDATWNIARGCRKVVSDCEKNQIPVFVKQLGTHLSKKLKLKDRHGGDINEFPQHLRIRNFPNINKYSI